MAIDWAGIAGGISEGFTSLFSNEGSVFASDSALWDMATGAAVGAGVAWATDNDIALGAGLGSVGGYLSSSGGYFDALPSSFDLSDMIMGKSGTSGGFTDARGNPISVNPEDVKAGLASGDIVRSAGSEGTKGLLGTDAGQKLVLAGIQGAASSSQQDELLDRQESMIREQRDAELAGRKITSATGGASVKLPSSQRTKDSLLARRS